MNEKLGNEILTKRKEKGLTQADIASHFGISVQAVSKWERGLSKPSEDILVKLVDLLGLTVEKVPQNKEKPWFTRFMSAVYNEIIRIICVGVILASVITFAASIISLDVCVLTVGAATAIFCFATVIKRG